MHIRLAHFSGSLIEANDQSCKCIGLKPNEHIPSKLVRSVAGTDLCVVCCLSCVSCLPSNATGCIRSNQTNTCDNCHSQFQHASHFVSIAQSKWLLASGKESYPVQFCMGNKCHTWSAFKLRFVLILVQLNWFKNDDFGSSLRKRWAICVEANRAASRLKSSEQSICQICSTGAARTSS